MRRRYAARSRQDVFREIYEKRLWGGGPALFSSGAGSTPAEAQIYAEAVGQFLTEKGVTSVVDVGCGNFTVGALLQRDGLGYVGIDLVDELVSHNQRHYGSPYTRFLCLDAVTVPLPEAEVALVRQVMQHLSNAEIMSMLANLRRYRYVIVTEHHPAPDKASHVNRDKPHGPDTRVLDGSAVKLDCPPFEANVVGTLLEVQPETCLVSPGECLRTVVIENPS